jgi:uncharacterized membrane protein HdeD (DUF308 family)
VYHQFKSNDGLDYDFGVAPALYTSKHGNKLAAGSKDGYLYGIDRATHGAVFKTPVTTIKNADARPTPAGVLVCPGPLGGVKRNGPAVNPVWRSIMTTTDPDFNEMQRAVADTLRAHWVMFLTQGVIMVVLGAVAFVAPTLASIAVDIFVGWLFLISGAVGLSALFWAHGAPALIWTLITAALSVVVGSILIWKPGEGAFFLTLVLTAFFIVEGIFHTVASFTYRNVMASSWGWMLASGAADLALAAIIIVGWPLSTGWILGLFVGINLITSGLALAMAATAGRNVAEV